VKGIFILILFVKRKVYFNVILLFVNSYVHKIDASYCVTKRSHNRKKGVYTAICQKAPVRLNSENVTSSPTSLPVMASVSWSVSQSVIIVAQFYKFSGCAIIEKPVS